jgi:hypothetical protein
MAKTPFVHGTIVTPEFLDKIFLYNGGHVHDGDDFDGHAAKIDLESHTVGKIDLATQTKGKIDLATQTSGKIDLATQVTGILPPENGGSESGGSSLQLVATLDLLPNYTFPSDYLLTSQASGPIAIYRLPIPSPPGSSASVSLALVVTPWFQFHRQRGYPVTNMIVAEGPSPDAMPFAPVALTLPGTMVAGGNGGESVTPTLTGRLMTDGDNVSLKLTEPLVSDLSPYAWYTIDVMPAMAWFAVEASA